MPCRPRIRVPVVRLDDELNASMSPNRSVWRCRSADRSRADGRGLRWRRGLGRVGLDDAVGAEVASRLSALGSDCAVDRTADGRAGWRPWRTRAITTSESRVSRRPIRRSVPSTVTPSTAAESTCGGAALPHQLADRSRRLASGPTPPGSRLAMPCRPTKRDPSDDRSLLIVMFRWRGLAFVSHISRPRTDAGVGGTAAAGRAEWPAATGPGVDRLGLPVPRHGWHRSDSAAMTWPAGGRRPPHQLWQPQLEEQPPYAEQVEPRRRSCADRSTPPEPGAEISPADVETRSRPQTSGTASRTSVSKLPVRLPPIVPTPY